MNATSRLAVLCFVFLTVTAGSMLVGRYPATLGGILSGGPDANLIANVRLPRILCALLLGACLAAAGCAFQTAFRNPLADSGILGISQGASFGAALAILVASANPIVLEVSALLFALGAFALVAAISRRLRYGDDTLRLLLAGLIVGAFFSGGVGIIKSIADPMKQLPEITFWLLGGLSSAQWREVAFSLPLAAGGLVALYLLKWRINLLSLEDDVSSSLGETPQRLRLWVSVAAVAAVASMTAVSGTVGWIGLLSPHLARRLVGYDTGDVLPASILIGATLTVMFDDISRVLMVSEIPLGVTVSIIGAPLFLFLLSRRQTHVAEN